MANPTQGDVQQVDPVLTQVLHAYYQSQDRFIAERIFPGVPVTKKSGTFYRFTRKYWTSDTMEKRAPGMKYPRGQFGVDTDTFETEQWALSKPIADEDEANNQMPMSLESAAVRWLGLKALIRKERMWAGDFMKTGVWGKDVTGSASGNGTTTFTKWSDTSGGDPVGNIGYLRRYMNQTTGYYPTHLIMGEIVRDRLIEHPDIAERVKYVERATAQNLENALADLFRVRNILVGVAVYNTANEGQDESLTPIFDDDALLLHVTNTPQMEEPSAGYAFNWAPGGGLGGIRPIVRDEEADADLIKFKMQLAYKKVAADLGSFMSDVTD